MRILCDVCGANEAAVFCCADEAALCTACDRRVHRANKLAGKHTRFSLLCSSSSQPHPLCDICQERRGFVFCKEDRAILCHECDSPIHAKNGRSMKHSRFILTGTRLSTVSIAASSPSSELSIPQKNVSAPFSPMAECSSSISEYLTKMLPGYRVEDFLLDDSMNYTAGDAFYESNELQRFVEGDLDVGDIRVAPATNWNFCVPDAPSQTHPADSVISAAAITGGSCGGVGVVEHGEELAFKEASRAHHPLVAPAAALASRNSRGQWSTEDVFTVPQLPCVPGSNKRHCRPSTLYF